MNTVYDIGSELATPLCKLIHWFRQHTDDISPPSAGMTQQLGTRSKGRPDAVSSARRRGLRRRPIICSIASISRVSAGQLNAVPRSEFATTNFDSLHADTPRRARV